MRRIGNRLTRYPGKRGRHGRSGTPVGRASGLNAIDRAARPTADTDRPWHPRRARGFTLLELLLASVLLAVLMVGVMSVITNVVQPAEAVAKQQAARDTAEPAALLADLLREELLHARTIDESTVQSIAFTGFGGLDPVTHERVQRPVRVRFFIEDIDGRSWVMRSEQRLDGEEQPGARRSLVCAGVTRFELIAPERETKPSQPDAEEAPNQPSDAVWRLRVWSDDRATPTVERRLVLSKSLKREGEE